MEPWLDLGNMSLMGRFPILAPSFPQLGSGALYYSKRLQIPTLLASAISGDSYFDIVFFHHPPQTGLNWAPPELEIE